MAIRVHTVIDYCTSTWDISRQRRLKGIKSRDTVPLKKQDPLNKCKILTSSLKSLGNFFQKVVLRSQETFWSCVCWQIGKVLQIELSNFGPANNGIIHNNNNNSKKLANV